MDVPSGDHATLGLVITVATVIGNGIIAILTKLSDFLLNYRKAADAGQLAIIQAQQADHAEELKQTKSELATVKNEVAACKSSHENCTKESAELRGQVTVLKELVVKDTADTNVLTARMADVERRQNGGQA